MFSFGSFSPYSPSQPLPYSYPGSGSASSLYWPSSTSPTTSSWSPSEASAGSSSTESSTQLQSSKWVLQTLSLVPNFTLGEWVGKQMSDWYFLHSYGGGAILGSSTELSLISAGPDGHWLGVDHSQYELWRLEALLSHHQVLLPVCCDRLGGKESTFRNMCVHANHLFLSQLLPETFQRYGATHTRRQTSS